MTKISSLVYSALLASSLLLSSGIAIGASSTKVYYTGKLIALPCTVAPGMEDLYVDMGVTPTKSLYRFTRTAGQRFEFELTDCDTSIASTISASFIGPINNEGLLKFNPNSEAKGAAIGLEYLDGRSITVNDGSIYSLPLRDGDMKIRLKAYVQGEQEALANKTLVPGDFTAVMTYMLSYE